MSNGNLLRDIKKGTAASNKDLNKKRRVAQEKTRLQNSVPDINEIAERASAANPFIPKKDIKYWLKNTKEELKEREEKFIKDYKSRTCIIDYINRHDMFFTKDGEDVKIGAD